MKPTTLSRAGRLFRLIFLLMTTPAAAVPPAELAALEKRRDALIVERVNGPFDKEMARLSKRYLAALEREIERCRKEGKLDDLELLGGEKLRVEDGAGLVDDGTTDPPVLKELRRKWRETIAKPSQARDEALGKLLGLYHEKLEELEARLGKEGRAEDAVAVRSIREAVAAKNRVGGTMPQVSTGAAAAPPAELEAQAPSSATTERLIYWALAQPNGKVAIRDAKGLFRWLKNENDNWKDERVPVGRFDLAVLEVTAVSPTGRQDFRPEWLIGQSGLEAMRLDLPFHDFSVLQGMKRLHTLEFWHHPVVTDDDLLQLPVLPAAKKVSITGAYGDRGVSILADRLPAIEQI